MAGNNLSVTLTARAVDEVSPTMKKIEGAVRGLPEQFSRVSSAMNMFGGAVGGLDGRLNAAAGKVTSFVSSLAAGGPAMAAVNLALGVAGDYLAKYQKELAEVEKAEDDARRSTEHMVQAYAKQTNDITRHLADIEQSIRNVGKTARQAQISENELQISNMLEGVGDLEEATERLRERIDAVYTVNGHLVESEEGRAFVEKQLSEQERAQLETLRSQLEVKSTTLELGSRRVEELQKESEKLRALEVVERRHEASVRASAEAATDAERAEKKRLEGLSQATRQAMSKSFGAQSDYYGRLADMQERDAKWQQQQDEQAQERLRDEQQRRLAMISAVAEAWGQATASMISGQQSAAKAMTIAALRSVQAIIVAYAAEAAASAENDAIKKFGIYGVAIGAAFASAAFAAVMAWTEKANFAFGGTVTGGTRGRDSVPAMLMPDEEVLPVGEARRYREARAAGTLYSGAGGGRGTTVVNVNAGLQALAIPSRAEMRRWILKSLKQPLEEMARSGQLNFALAR